MFQSGLLVLSMSALRRSSPLSVVQRCSQSVQKILYVHLVSDDTDFSDHSTLPRVPFVHGIRRYITDFYTNATHVSQSMDVRFLLSNISNLSNPVLTPLHLCHGYDVILTDVRSDLHLNLRNYLSIAFPSITTETKTLEGLGELDVREVEEFSHTAVDGYDFVALGGTFDRLHVGHKILLSQSCILCRKAVTVGVTDGEMNKRKILPELMQTTSDRVSAIKEFLLDIKPNIEHRVVAITDIYGPAITDSSLQCLVVSQETIRGWELINSKRKSQDMPELDLDVIELVADLNHAAEEEEKVSSSTSRIRLLGTLLKRSKASHRQRPFVIGLTGGTASGKSSICKRLEKLGAGIIDCDRLGHRSYQPGTSTFQQVVDAFGKEVVDAGGLIDRRVLGSKVFGNKEMMNRLNAIVWPAIARLAAEELKTLADKGVEVVVLDAAVLLEAGWDEMVDEVWATVIPKQEAVKRLMDRNKLTEEQSKQRIDSQMTNEERVDHASVLLCTLWHPEVTQKQVEKAWHLLQERLKTSNCVS